MNEAFLQSDLFAWVILPSLIFIARVLDVSIGTIRLIFVSKGIRILAPILGFFEILIWLIAITQIMQRLDNVACYIAYALGFAFGNYIGIILEDKLSIGTVVFRVFPKKDTSKLIDHLRSHGYGVSAIEIEGMSGKNKMLVSIIKRKNLEEVVNIVNQFNPNAFYTVEDVRAVKEGYFKIPARRRLDVGYGGKRK